MKNFEELLISTLNQRHIVDNRQVVLVSDITPSVLIAFHRACKDVLNLHNWTWNMKEISFETAPDRNSYPMPFGIIKGLVLSDAANNKCPLDYVDELTATQGCPTQWTFDWQNEEIAIAPAEKENQHIMTIKYYDKNIAWVGPRSDGILLEDFLDEETQLPDGTNVTAKNQYLNVPNLIYNVYAECVITLTRVYLNEGAQPSVLEEQKREFENAKNSLLEFAKTPFYDAQRYEL